MMYTDIPLFSIDDAFLGGYTDYYPGGMAMPNRGLMNAYGYRYAFQGQEKDPETGKEAFELRLWDSRIGRWLTTDPYGQFDSPYIGMANNPANVVDPDGGFACIDADGNAIPCPKGYEQYNGPTKIDAFFDNDLNLMGFGQALDGVVVSASLIPRDAQSNALAVGGIVTSIFENINIGQLKESGDFRIYSNLKGPKFSGNQHTKLFKTGRAFKIGGNVLNAMEIGGDVYDVLTTEGEQQEQEFYGLLGTTGGVVIGKVHPVLGIIITGGDIIGNTEWYHKQKQIVRERQIQERLSRGEFGLTLPWDPNATFRQGSY